MIEAIYADFVRFMDEIFYEGYAEQLAKEFPEQFNIEWNEFVERYGIREGEE
jgi:hypothetical protein